MKKLLYITVCFLFVSASILFADNHEEDETSELANAAQVQKAENLAKASQDAASDDVKDAQKEVDDAQDAYDEAASALEADPENLELQAALQEAQTNLDNALDKLSDVAGASKEEIQEMRDSGMGWGEIAHELGVHPSTLGLGHNKVKNERKRDTNSFKSTSEFSSNSNTAKAKGLQGKASKENASSNERGNSGNKGGNQKGNAGGNSGNKGGNGNGKGGGKN